MLKDINYGKNSSHPLSFTIFNNELCFSYDIENKRQLWKTDGTESGTIRVTNLSWDSEPETVTIGRLTPLDDKLVFCKYSPLVVYVAYM